MDIAAAVVRHGVAFVRDVCALLVKLAHRLLPLLRRGCRQAAAFLAALGKTPTAQRVTQWLREAVQVALSFTLSPWGAASAAADLSVLWGFVRCATARDGGCTGEGVGEAAARARSHNAHATPQDAVPGRITTLRPCYHLLGASGGGRLLQSCSASLHQTLQILQLIPSRHHDLPGRLWRAACAPALRRLAGCGRAPVTSWHRPSRACVLPNALLRSRCRPRRMLACSQDHWRSKRACCTCTHACLVVLPHARASAPPRSQRPLPPSCHSLRHWHVTAAGVHCARTGLACVRAPHHLSSLPLTRPLTSSCVPAAAADSSPPPERSCPAARHSFLTPRCNARRRLSARSKSIARFRFQALTPRQRLGVAHLGVVRRRSSRPRLCSCG